MTTPEQLLRSHLTGAENALVCRADVAAALERARQGRAPRTRVEIAALLVHRGAGSSRVPPLESRPLRRPALVRLLTGVRRPVPVPALSAVPAERCAPARLLASAA